MTVSPTGALRPLRVDDPTRTSEWRSQAACRGRDPEIWFSVGTTGPALLVTAHAKSICHTECPVRSQCLSWAMEHGEDAGVWGGLDEEERRTLKRRRHTRERARQAVTAS